MLKIAYCLYGQPRNLENGHKIISTFVANHDVDFYYHTWTLDENNFYSYSYSYRELNLEELRGDSNIISKINKLYNPKAYISELSRVFEYENNEKFKNSLLFKNTNEFNKDNNKISNVFSNYYSKQQVRNLLKETLENEKIDYDFVILSRFDMLKEINIDLSSLNTKKVYVSNLHNPRYIFSDAILIMNIENYLEILNVYDNLENLLNNNTVNELVNSYNEKLVFVPESLLFGNYLYYFKNLKKIEYIDLPNFY